ncbi:ABC transporter substrate-binding protein [Georgenia deserti]|uniref:ABC transporter substrate-binding protein n=1 Tax=Georgenia deserti TaxID=2093781 RepID=A0ABW4LAD7_9MICO
MTQSNYRTSGGVTRRTVLRAGTVAAALGLSGCARWGFSDADTRLKFWNMPWGQTNFTPLDREITLGYEPEAGTPPAAYQVIQWANFIQTFTSAVASRTGPAVSSGGGTLAFQFESQGAIAYADGLLESWRANGLYDDFLPGLLETMRVPNGFAAVPYNLDMRVLWYNRTLLERAGVEPPTDWQSYLDACAALKRIDVYGYGTGSGAGSFTGSHALTSWMINNGGGLFNENQEPACVTDQNIEAMEFVLEMVHKGYVDPRSPTYTSDNVMTQWQQHRFGMGYDTGGLANNVGGAVKDELEVMSPLRGPSGDQGALFFPNNIMMYTDSPSQQASEAFMTYYFQNMTPLWTENTGIGLPPLRSITQTDEFQADRNSVKIIDEWQPVARTWAAPGGDALFIGVTAVDATPMMITFTQSILSGQTDATTALTRLQREIEASISNA